ncbi:hypothetical protein [Dactylosporangium sp. NPDC005555]|uniref:hypothetical protein n=1 Tax=Dactylosporangium sp. NPDC005555 TaxID=3154889 RepID=UPI0033A1DF0B
MGHIEPPPLYRYDEHASRAAAAAPVKRRICAAHRPCRTAHRRKPPVRPRMDLHDAGCQARFLIRDRDGKYPALFDTILADTGITVVLTGVQMPRMNAIMDRWIQTCRYELLDRMLIFNQRHLPHAPDQDWALAWPGR